MTYYLAAYAIFWAVLFGYLLGLSSRQRTLNARAARLRERLAEKGRDRNPDASSRGPASEPESDADASPRGPAPEESG